jgi:hypothetical protein
VARLRCQDRQALPGEEIAEKRLDVILVHGINEISPSARE